MRLTTLAELYLESSPEQRRELRHSLEVGDESRWELIAYVRRIAKLINSENDTRWLRCGLAIASLENGGFDFRDLIVSLDILRHAAERAGIDTTPYFHEAIEMSSPEIHGQNIPDIHNILKRVGEHTRSELWFAAAVSGFVKWWQIWK